jgi:hypothetical protein
LRFGLPSLRACQTLPVVTVLTSRYYRYIQKTSGRVKPKFSHVDNLA